MRFSLELPDDEHGGRLAALERVGVTWSTVTPPGATRAEVLDGIEAFGRAIIRELTPA